MEVVRDTVAECRFQGKEIRTVLMTSCRTAEQRFANYLQCFEGSQVGTHIPLACPSNAKLEFIYNIHTPRCCRRR